MFSILSHDERENGLGYRERPQTSADLHSFQKKQAAGLDPVLWKYWPSLSFLSTLRLSCVTYWCLCTAFPCLPWCASDHLFICHTLLSLPSLHFPEGIGGFSLSSDLWLVLEPLLWHFLKIPSQEKKKASKFNFKMFLIYYWEGAETERVQRQRIHTWVPRSEFSFQSCVSFISLGQVWVVLKGVCA